MKVHLNFFKSILFIISKNSFFCVMLLWFIFILILGTITQKEMGLISVQEKFFYSNVIWLFVIPLPGGKLTLIIIFISLFIKLFELTWTIKKMGTIIIHFSILFLLFGGIVTYYFSDEGFIVLQKNKTSSQFISNNEKAVIFTYDNKTFTLDANIKEHFCENFKINLNNNYNNYDLIYKKKFLDNKKAINDARFFDIIETPTYLEEDKNNFLTSVDIIKNNNIKLSLYLKEDEEKLSIDEEHVTLGLEKFCKNLPFSLSLLTFEKKNYIGSNLPKSYKSKILISDNGIKWECNIKMNEPLKYKGYTLYQTSFLENKNEISSVLTITKNKGEYFPYISCFMLIFGFLIHILKFISKDKKWSLK